MRKFATALPALLVLLACLAVFGLSGPILDRVEVSHASAQLTLARQAIEQDDILRRIDLAITAVADAVRPSVVHLDVITGERGRRSRSNGSGWVYDDSGHIVTNAHVVRGARAGRVSVEFADGRVIDRGSIVGIDPFTDIAVVRVDPGAGLFPLTRASGQAVRQGQRAFAFGSPFGFKFSMSEGIVSGLGRAPGASAAFGGFTNYIQTDAAVNPGNSGGPLVDVSGSLIGMNVAIATGRDTDGTTEGDSAGISFAIPLETIESIVPQLINSGRVARGFLGINFSQFNEEVVLDDGSRLTGPAVTNVTRDGPSERAGLRPGDIILKMRGQPITDGEVLRSIVGSTPAGERITVEFARGGRVQTAQVQLGEMPADTLARLAAPAMLTSLGVGFIEGDDNEVLVGDTFPGSVAAARGLKPGQTVLSVNARPARQAIDVYIGLNEGGLLAGQTVPIVVRDLDGSERAIELRLPY